MKHARPFVRLAALAALFVGANASADVIAIQNAEVHTLGPAGTLAHGTVIVRNGRIEAVGADLAVPTGATVIDGSGKVLTPGVIAPLTQLGLKEIDGVEETDDVASKQPRFSAGLDVTDGLNPRSALLPVNRIEGVTTAITAPGSRQGGSLIAGQGAVISLAGTRAAEGSFVLKPRVAVFAQIGENGAPLTGGTRPATLAALREALEEAKPNGLRPGAGLWRAAQLGPFDVAALKPVLAGQTPLVLYANRASDITAAVKLADEYGIHLIISGAAEAHLVAKTLVEHRVPVLIDPTLDLPAHFETLHGRPDAAQLLQRAGVRFAFIDDSEFATHNARNLRQLAGIAVSYGLSKDAALAAITRAPAEIYGLSEDRGSIERGKVADLVLWDGDPLEVTSAATQVFIAGAAMPMISRQTLLRDRYLQRLKAKTTP
jgi:imidazolonepropionase-like amidohydrolase